MLNSLLKKCKPCPYIAAVVFILLSMTALSVTGIVLHCLKNITGITTTTTTPPPTPCNLSDPALPALCYLPTQPVIAPTIDYSAHPVKAVRLHNPGNIKRYSKTVWVGEAAVQQDKTICTFEAPEYGIRAIGRILVNYQKKYNHNTVRAIISRYAPAHENRTDEYTTFVARQLGIGVDTPIDVKDHLTPFVTAIIEYETGAASIYPVEAFALLAEADGDHEK